MKRVRNGPRPVTLREVADAAGVHFSTVSRVINPATRGQITSDVAHRVLAIAEQLGYRANTLASSLRTRRSHAVGVVVPDITSLLFPPILQGIEETLIEKGYVSIIGNTDNDPARHARVLREMMGRQIDGLILATATLHDPVIEEWTKRGVPLVMINRTDETGHAPSVITDELRGMALAVNHVAALGHTLIGHVAGPQGLSTGATRAHGFRLAMAALGLPAAPEVMVAATVFGRDAGRAACAQLLKHRPHITAIVAANDLLALGCYDALRDLGLACPETVSVTGYNDLPFVDMVMPPLTTIRIRQREMGAQAAHVLLRWIENDQASNVDIVLRPSLVVRQSTAPPRKI